MVKAERPGMADALVVPGWNDPALIAHCFWHPSEHALSTSGGPAGISPAAKAFARHVPPYKERPFSPCGTDGSAAVW
jgi:hypothetical protein